MMKKQPTFQRPRAQAPQKIFRRCIKLLPALARRGAAPLEALAVAYNATYLFYNIKRPLFMVSPRQILSRYTLSEIAELCGEISKGGAGIKNGFKEAAG